MARPMPSRVEAETRIYNPRCAVKLHLAAAGQRWRYNSTRLPTPNTRLPMPASQPASHPTPLRPAPPPDAACFSLLCPAKVTLVQIFLMRQSATCRLLTHLVLSTATALLRTPCPSLCSSPWPALGQVVCLSSLPDRSFCTCLAENFVKSALSVGVAFSLSFWPRQRRSSEKEREREGGGAGG